MRKSIIISMWLILLSGTAFCQSLRSAENVIKEYLRQYPKSELKDVYKFCFQDYFGPGHLVENPEASKAYLREEMSSATILGGPLYEPVGLEGNFYRVNISVVMDNKVPFDLFFDALVRSAFPVEQNDIDNWKQTWRSLEDFLLKYMADSPNAQAQAEQIRQHLAQDQYAGFHSAVYNAIYNFHYRVIRKDIFENEIKPLL